MQETVKITPEDKRYLDEAIAKANSDIQEMREEMAVAHSTAGDGWHDNQHITLVGHENGFFLRLRRYEEILKQCEVVEVEEQNYEVRLGSIVLMKDHEGEHYAQLTGIAIGERGVPLISGRSPLGQQLLGKHYGDVMNSPDGSEITILDIMTPTEYEAVKPSGS